MTTETEYFKAYNYLSKEAMQRAKRGRAAILQAERDFHEALYALRAHFPPGMFRDLEKHWTALSEYPAVLRSVLDAQDEAHELNAHARHSLTMHRIMVEDGKKDSVTTPQE